MKPRRPGPSCRVGRPGATGGAVAGVRVPRLAGDVELRQRHRAADDGRAEGL